MIISASLRRQVIERGGELLRVFRPCSDESRGGFPRRPCPAGHRRWKHDIGKSGTGLRLLLPAQGPSPACARPTNGRSRRALSSAPRLVASAFPLGGHASCGYHTYRTRNGCDAQHESPASIGDPRRGSASRKASAASACFRQTVKATIKWARGERKGRVDSLWQRQELLDN